jgi:hypothetical protein
MKNIPFSQILQHLAETNKPIPAAHLARFSDLEGEDLQALQTAWGNLPLPRRQTLLAKLSQTFAEDDIASFDSVAALALQDEDETVRGYALGILRETEDPRLLPRLFNILAADPALVCRAAAADTLGQFMRLGEEGQIPARDAQTVRAALLAACQSHEPMLARPALASLAYATDPQVSDLLAQAFERPDSRWQETALLAAAHSADSRWQGEVLAALGSPNASVRRAAAEAAGELELKTARPTLLQMLEDEEEDPETIAAIVWSLSQIGGEDVRTYLETLLDQSEDDDFITLLEDALDNLAFTEDLEKFDLLAIDEEEPPA